MLAREQPLATADLRPASPSGTATAPRSRGCIHVITRDESLYELVLNLLPSVEIIAYESLPTARFGAVTRDSALIVDAASARTATGLLEVCAGKHDLFVVGKGGASSSALRVQGFERGDVAAAAVFALRSLDVPDDSLSEWVLGKSRDAERIRQQISSVSQFSDVSVLLLGETGTGKDVVARAIHRLSQPDAPYVPVNSAAIPESLFESELFGHEAGAYTGAKARRGGLMEMAGSGTLFLDEIGDMPIGLQPKLLRALESRTFRRVGSDVDLPLRARIISATNRQVDAAGGGHFRSDLFFRLAGFVIEIPPLRRRPDDILPLATFFLSEFTRRYGLDEVSLSAAARDLLLAHRWPGNIRQLRAVLEHAAILARGDRVEEHHLRQALVPPRAERASVPPPTLPTPHDEVHESDAPQPTLHNLEASLIRRTWEQSGHNVSRTAKKLGIARSTLRDRLKKYGITSAVR